MANELERTGQSLTEHLDAMRRAVWQGNPATLEDGAFAAELRRRIERNTEVLRVLAAPDPAGALIEYCERNEIRLSAVVDVGGLYLSTEGFIWVGLMRAIAQHASEITERIAAGAEVRAS